MRISSEISRQLKDWAIDAHPNECCGLIFGSRKDVQEIELVENIATEPLTGFEIDPVRLIAAEKQSRSGGKQLIGYFHSHPNGAESPSAKDAAAMAANDNRVWLIVTTDAITGWKLSKDSQFLEQELVFG